MPKGKVVSRFASHFLWNYVLLSDPAFRLEAIAACLATSKSPLLLGKKGDVKDINAVQIENPESGLHWAWQIIMLVEGRRRIRYLTVGRADDTRSLFTHFGDWTKRQCTDDAKIKTFVLLHNASLVGHPAP